MAQTRRTFLATLGLAALGLVGRGARALTRAGGVGARRPVLVRGPRRTLILPRAFVETYRPRIWVRRRGPAE